jgi:hypothetical protein
MVKFSAEARIWMPVRVFRRNSTSAPSRTAVTAIVMRLSRGTVSEPRLTGREADDEILVVRGSAPKSVVARFCRM